MCGIAAILDLRATLSADVLRALAAPVHHRGPDDEGIVLFSGQNAEPSIYGGEGTPAEFFGAPRPYLPQIHLPEAIPSGAFLALLHRRLSILDLTSGGHQPMCFDDGTLWIAFNGEIYNFVELRTELEAGGIRFNSHSDTEVLLAAYRRWDTGCLSRLRGMFSFILFDRRTRKLVAARDRFGIKPLYYWISPEGSIIFCSEIKQLFDAPGWKSRINGQRAYDFLSWAILDHTDETLFAGVRQVRNGEYVELRLNALPVLECGGKLPATKWYELRGTPFEGDQGTAALRFRELFYDAVRIHLRADVPVGSCLSGGLDSSSIVCVMNDMLGERGADHNQRTFSACSDVARFDERRFIEEVISCTGVAAEYVHPDVEDLFGLLDRLVWHQDEPFGSTSILAQWKVFGTAARAGVKVMLDGQGADEQLGGYEAFQAARLTGLFRSLRWGLLLSEVRAATHTTGQDGWWAVKHVLDGVLPNRIRLAARKWAGKLTVAPEWIDLHVLGAFPADPYRGASGDAATSVTELSFRQLTHSNLQMLLHWEDRSSMAHSIEARVPFLDHRLVEFVVGLPDDYKLSGGMTKRVLREAMRGILPEPVRTRTDKLGFVTPEEVWVRERAPERFKAAAREAVSGCSGILSPKAIDVADRIIDGAVPYSFALWRIISFGAWMRRFNVAAP